MMLYVSPLHIQFLDQRGCFAAWDGDEASLKKVAHLKVAPRYLTVRNDWFFYQITQDERAALMEAGVVATGERGFVALFAYGITPDERKGKPLGYADLYQNKKAKEKNRQRREALAHFIRQWRYDNPPPKRGK